MKPRAASVGRVSCECLPSETVQTFPHQELMLKILTLLIFVVDFLKYIYLLLHIYSLLLYKVRTSSVDLVITISNEN